MMYLQSTSSSAICQDKNAVFFGQALRGQVVRSRAGPPGQRKEALPMVE